MQWFRAASIGGVQTYTNGLWSWVDWCCKYVYLVLFSWSRVMIGMHWSEAFGEWGCCLF